MRAVTAQLHQIGVDLSLDDFGTGYSSLRHLHQIPLHTLKIDRAFARDVDTDPHTRRFMRALLALGHDLDLQVVIEGVEHHTQAETLRHLGATLAQGYLYSPALPPTAAHALLHHPHRRPTKAATIPRTRPRPARTPSAP